MANFGRPTFGLTKNLKQMVIYEVPNNPGHVYQFRKNRQAREHSNWTCVGCEQFVKRNRGASVAKIQISNEPDQWILTSPMNPNPAHSCAGPTTLEGANSMDINDPAYEEIYLIHEDVQSPFFVFASKLDFQTLHRSEHIIMDGTFESFPEIFTQMYTIHAFINGESIPVIFALLPDKRQATYEQLLRIVRNNLIQLFGSIGRLNGGFIHIHILSTTTTAFEFNNC